MSDDLVERVARAFCVVDGADPCEVVCDWCSHRARPVVAVALEEAAMVCERRFMGDHTREDMEARRCAAAIRALIPQEPA